MEQALVVGSTCFLKSGRPFCERVQFWVATSQRSFVRWFEVTITNCNINGAVFTNLLCRGLQLPPSMLLLLGDHHDASYSSYMFSLCELLMVGMVPGTPSHTVPVEEKTIPMHYYWKRPVGFSLCLKIIASYDQDQIIILGAIKFSFEVRCKVLSQQALRCFCTAPIEPCTQSCGVSRWCWLDSDIHY